MLLLNASVVYVDCVSDRRTNVMRTFWRQPACATRTSESGRGQLVQKPEVLTSWDVVDSRHRAVRADGSVRHRRCHLRLYLLHAHQSGLQGTPCRRDGTACRRCGPRQEASRQEASRQGTPWRRQHGRVRWPRRRRRLSPEAKRGRRWPASRTVNAPVSLSQVVMTSSSSSCNTWIHEIYRVALKLRQLFPLLKSLKRLNRCSWFLLISINCIAILFIYFSVSATYHANQSGHFKDVSNHRK